MLRALLEAVLFAAIAWAGFKLRRRTKGKEPGTRRVIGTTIVAIAMLLAFAAPPPTTLCQDDAVSFVGSTVATAVACASTAGPIDITNASPPCSVAVIPKRPLPAP